MEKIILKRFVKKEQEKSYIHLPFTVPSGIERMEIKYYYEGDEASSLPTGEDKNVIDLALLDPEGCDVGTRGNSVYQVVISPSYSTEGYKTRRIDEGIWTVILGAYMVKKIGVEVTFEISLFEEEYRWLKGDTHLHTNNSDGKLTYFELAKKARKKGMDYIIITDHNNNTQGFSMPKINGLTVIRGLELTSYFGHINMFGCEKPYENTYAFNNFDEFKVINEQAKNNGAIQSLCHPLCSMCPWKMGFNDFHFDLVEIWNGPMRKDNLKAVEFWDSLLKEGKKIPMVGGSDYHRDYVVTDLIGEPTTRVYAKSQAPEDILSAIKEGRSVVTKGVNTTMLDISVDERKIGDSVKFREGQEVKVTVLDMKRGHTLYLVGKSGRFFEFSAKKRGNYKFIVPLTETGYVRAEIMYSKHGLNKLIHKIILLFMLPLEAKEKIPPFVYAITNPIYLD